MSSQTTEAATIHGLDASKLREPWIDYALGELKLQTKGALPKKVDRLKRHFADRDKTKLEDAAVCDVCGAVSDTSKFKVCPFCGCDENQQPQNPPEIAAALKEIGPAESEVVAEKPALALVPKETSKANGKHEPADVGPAVAQQMTSLDTEVAEIKRLQAGTSAGAWLMARRLAEIAKNDLWKQRLTEDGKVAYKTFEQFAKAELAMGKRYANELLKLQERFDEKAFREIGPTKLRLVLAAGPEKKAEVLDRLKKGQGRRQIEREALGRDKGKKDGRKKETKAAAKEGTITIASILGRHKVKTVKKPTSKGQTEFARAKRIADVPWGVLDLANDTRLFLTIVQNPAGEIDIYCDFKRVDAEE